MGEPVWIWGLPLVPWTRVETADRIMALVEAGRPSYFITANVHYAMLSGDDPRLRTLNDAAAFVVADGAPLVWASRWLGTALPERVAGSDLIYDLCTRAAARGLRLFLLGGPEGIAEEAGRRLSTRYPGLVIAGTAAPPHRSLDAEERGRLLDQIRDARPDLLLVAFGQPKGEFWIAEHHRALGVPVSVQVGATLEFVAGRVRRAPRWLQRIGMEWSYRMWLEPRRLAPRYARNAAFLARQVAADLLGRAGRWPALRNQAKPPGGPACGIEVPPGILNERQAPDGPRPDPARAGG